MPHNNLQGADAPGLSAPHKNEAPRLAGAEGFGDQDKADTTIVADLDDQRKAFLTLRARAAMAGHALSRVEPDAGEPFYLVSRWNMSRSLPDLPTVELFLRQVGAPN